MNEHIKNRHSLKYYTGLHKKMRELNKKGQRPKEFGNKVWATSLVLLDYLHSKPFVLEGLRVLEIGCGWGLLGVYLAKEHNCIVTCSDFDEAVLPIVDAHAELNEVEVNSVRSSFSGFTAAELQQFDLIVGAEVCYSSEAAKDLSLLLQRSFEAKVKYFLIADPGRPDFEDCKNLCSKLSSTEVIDLPGTVNGKSTQLLLATN